MTLHVQSLSVTFYDDALLLIKLWSVVRG